MQKINRIKDKNHVIISISVEKALAKIQHPFMIKALKQLGAEEMYLNILKAVCDKLTVNIVLNGKIPKLLPLKSGMRQMYPLSPSYLIF
jgi:hypothetical protein